MFWNAVFKFIEWSTGKGLFLFFFCGRFFQEEAGPTSRAAQMIKQAENAMAQTKPEKGDLISIFSGIFRDPQGHGTPFLVSYPYKPPIRIPKDMGMAWEYYGNLTRRGPISLGVPGITLDIGMRLVIFSFPLAGCNATDSIYCSVRMTGENDSSCYFMDPLAEKVNAIAGVSGFGENGRFFFVEDFKNFWHPRTKRVSRKTSWSFGMEELWKVSLPSD